ncbi:hypothetical protein Trydic_g7733 [Trypoxylus dichotomus]
MTGYASPGVQKNGCRTGTPSHPTSQRESLKSLTSAELTSPWSPNCPRRAKSPSATGDHTRPPNAPNAEMRQQSVLCARARIQQTERLPQVAVSEVPAQQPKTAAPKPAQRPAPRRPEAPKVSARPAEKGSVPMKVDQHDEAAAVRKSTAKTVKTKTSKKGKTPSAPSLSKPSPKKPVASKPPTKPTPAIVEEVADYDASETTSRPEANVLATFTQLIPLIQKINWQKLLQVAASLLPKLLKCRSTYKTPCQYSPMINGRHRRPQSMTITVNLVTAPVKLVAAYKASNRQLLEDELSEIFDTRGAVILASDLNAKHPSWNWRVTNASGNCLRRFADDFHLLVDAIAEPTIFPHNR